MEYKYFLWTQFANFGLRITLDFFRAQSNFECLMIDEGNEERSEEYKCPVYFRSSTDSYVKEFVTEENFGDKMYELLEEGKCSILALGLSRLNYKWKQVATELLNQNKTKIIELIIVKGTEYQLETLNYLSENYHFEINIEELSYAVKGKHDELQAFANARYETHNKNASETLSYN